MTRGPTPKLGGYAWLVALGLIAGSALQRPELIAVAAPFALLLVLASSAKPPEAPGAELRVRHQSAAQGDRVELGVALDPGVVAERIDVSVALPAGLRPVAGGRVAVTAPGRRLALAGRYGEPPERTLNVECARLGRQRIASLTVRARDLLGCLVTERHSPTNVEIGVYPRLEPLRQPIRGRETQLFGGDQVARARGEGIEFAELRPLQAGEPIRRLNWRATARRGVPLVAERHPERNVDLVLFLDAFPPELGEGDEPLFERAVTAAASVARRHLRRRDRVALVSFGGLLSWLRPRMGAAQLPRVLDALLEIPVTVSYAWKEVRSIPAGVLAPQATVVALSPLLDARMTRAILDLRARGFDVALIEISPLPYLAPPPTELERLAQRLWLLERDELRRRYRSLGVRVGTWEDDQPLDRALAEVNRWPRQPRAAHV